MLYPYMTFNDETEITHSEMKEDGRVKVYIETPIDGGFKCATCWLPDYTWEDIDGYSEAEIEKLFVFIKKNAHLLIEFSQDGGVIIA